MAFPPERRQPGACDGVTLLPRYVGYSGAVAFLRQSPGGPTPRSGPFRGGTGPAPSPSARWLWALFGRREAGARSSAGPRGPTRAGELLARGVSEPGPGRGCGAPPAWARRGGPRAAASGPSVGVGAAGRPRRGRAGLEPPSGAERRRLGRSAAPRGAVLPG